MLVFAQMSELPAIPLAVPLKMVLSLSLGGSQMSKHTQQGQLTMLHNVDPSRNQYIRQNFSVT
jgi:hypothetical protein